MYLSSFLIHKEILYRSYVFSAFRPPRPPGLDFSFLPPSQKHTDFLTEPYQNEAFPAQGPPGPGLEVRGPDFSFWAISQKDTDFLTEAYQNEASPALRNSLSHPEAFRPGVSDLHSS